MLSRQDMAAALLNAPPTVITKVDLTHILALYPSVQESGRVTETVHHRGPGYYPVPSKSQPGSLPSM